MDPPLVSLAPPRASAGPRASQNPLQGRRLPCQIMHELLRLAGEGAGKTRLMYGANLSYALLTRYLAFLEGKGFLERRGDGRGYVVTEKGHQFRADLARVLKHFNADDVAPPAVW